MKDLGEATAQVILAAGYVPAGIAIAILWKACTKWQEKVLEMLALKFADASNAKDLWSAQAKVIEDQTRTIHGLEKQVAGLADEVRRLRP